MTSNVKAAPGYENNMSSHTPSPTRLFLITGVAFTLPSPQAKVKQYLDSLHSTADIIWTDLQGPKVGHAVDLNWHWSRELWIVNYGPAQFHLR